eukprot:6463831-Amphidinium_carterae.2
MLLLRAQWTLVGIDIEKAMVVIFEVATRWLQCYPVKTTRSDEICNALGDLCGPQAQHQGDVLRQRSRTNSSCLRKSWVRERSIPEMSKSNGLV